MHWIVDGAMINTKFEKDRLAEWDIVKGRKYGVYDKESADAARKIGKSVTPVRIA